MEKKEEGNALRCSFCGQTEHEVKKLIAGKGVYICDQCIGLCSDILYEQAADRSDVRGAFLLQVAELARTLNWLSELSKEMGDGMPHAIQQAIEALESAFRRLQSSLPELPGSAEAGERAPIGEGVVDVRDLWPVLSGLVETTNALLSMSEKLPEMLPAWQSVVVKATRLDLSLLTEFLGGGQAPEGLARPAPRD